MSTFVAASLLRRGLEDRRAHRDEQTRFSGFGGRRADNRPLVGRYRWDTVCDEPQDIRRRPLSRGCRLIAEDEGSRRTVTPFLPAFEGTNSSRALSVPHGPATLAYLNDLKPVDASEVKLFELLHTLFAFAPMMTADQYEPAVAKTLREVETLFRDPAGTLVARCRDSEHWLLWPLARPAPPSDQINAVLADEGGAYLSTAAGVIPLSATSIHRCGFGWGYSGTGPVNLYKALVYAVYAERAPIPMTRFNDDPRSMYGWIVRLPEHQPVEVPWSEIVRRADADRPLRDTAERVGR